MTYPCIDPNHFEVDYDGRLRPQPWMQFRRVATAKTTSVESALPTTGGGDKDILLQYISAYWTNSSPVQQYVYGMVTRGGLRVVLTASSRGYLLMSHAAQVDSQGTLQAVSKVGIGGQAGKAGIFAGDAFAIVELRQNAITMPLMPKDGGLTLMNPWQTFYADVEVRFKSDKWQSGTIDGGNTQTESGYVTGDTQIDLFAIPAI